MASFALADDLIYRFKVDSLNLVGRVVRLGTSIDQILRQHDYPHPVSVLLGELVTVTAALAATLKFDGRFIAQVQGNGPVRMLVADYRTGGGMRGTASFDAAQVAAHDRVTTPWALVGDGHMAMTVDQGADSERYQGIVGLEGNNLDDAMAAYFRQSEQIRASLRVGVSRAANGNEAGWRAGCVLIQQQPDTGGAERPPAWDDDSWEHAVHFVETVKTDELTSPSLSPVTLLDRLFGAGNLAIFRPDEVRFSCPCSDQRARTILESLPAAEVAELSIDGQITVTCEFCNAVYAFDEGSIAGARSS